MSTWITNARMYAVTPGVEAYWRELLERISREAGVALEFKEHGHRPRVARTPAQNPAATAKNAAGEGLHQP